MSSKQQAAYLAERAKGRPMMQACVAADFPVDEARLVEMAISRGELSLPEPPGVACNSEFGCRNPRRCGVLRRCDILIEPNPAAGQAAPPQKELPMARKAKPGDDGQAKNGKVTNLTETRDLIRNAVPEIINIDEKIKALRDRRNQLRAAVQAAGVGKQAFDLALRVRKMDPEDRQSFDEGFVIAREAVGLRVQRGLFETLEGDDDESQPDGRARMSDGQGGAGAPSPDAMH